MIDFKPLMQYCDKHILPKQLDYIFRKRFCNKHMREYIKKHNITNPQVRVISHLGFCDMKHKRAGIVYYLEGELEK